MFVFSSPTQTFSKFPKNEISGYEKAWSVTYVGDLYCVIQTSRQPIRRLNSHYRPGITDRTQIKHLICLAVLNHAHLMSSFMIFRMSSSA